MSRRRRLWGGAVLVLGYMLSPLSWWNDLFFNLPIALAVGYAADWLRPGWLVVGTIGGYWFSNVLGLWMMQWGVTDAFFSPEQRHLRRDLLLGLGGSTLYTLGVLALLHWHIIALPSF